ncbi:hypothetical protein [Kitasatospora sp. NBC_01266]|uniref:hypothetical protein n=1 Tax=Kitasatospora sp. NBC_01266 TaxID=2903572 RepID=UPI002E30039D|nr:hypothetical protein [Kitasatospora sp. NBC_01266]
MNVAPTGPVRTVVVVGSGALARSVVYALADTDPGPTAVHLIARSAGRLSTMAHVATCRAALLGSPVRFTPHRLDAERPGDSVAALVGAVGADVVLNCASTHSPSEVVARPSGWTDLIRAAGIALALPFHASFAARLCEAVARSGGPGTLFLNAALPDAVNPVLAALGGPIHCGVGNIATVAASLADPGGGLGAGAADDPGQRLRVLGHHHHLAAPADPRDEARVWHGDVELTDVGRRLAPMRACDRRLLHELTGHTAALLVRDLLRERAVRAHVPGPLGLPGGYPVRLAEGRITLDLPPGITEAEAVDLQSRWGRADGVAVDRHGNAEFADRVLAASAPHLKLPPTAEPGQLIALADELAEVRDRLRNEEARSDR